MTKPITDKAEIALEYPDKLYVGTFDRSSQFEAQGSRASKVRATPVEIDRCALGSSLFYCPCYLFSSPTRNGPR